MRDAGSYYRLSNYSQKIPNLIGIPKRQPLTFVLGATAQTDLRHAPLLTRGLRPFFARFALRKYNGALSLPLSLSLSLSLFRKAVVVVVWPPRLTEVQ